MLAFVRIPGSAMLLAIATSALSASCGGKVIFEADPECECESDLDCLPDTACGEHSCQRCSCVLDSAPKRAECPDGYCDGEGSCVDREQICSRACEVIPVCLTSTPTECYDFCFSDLADCDADQLADTDDCTDELVAPECDGDAWLSCVTRVRCLSTEQPQ